MWIILNIYWTTLNLIQQFAIRPHLTHNEFCVCSYNGINKQILRITPEHTNWTNVLYDMCALCCCVIWLPTFHTTLPAINLTTTAATALTAQIPRHVSVRNCNRTSSTRVFASQTLDRVCVTVAILFCCGVRIFIQNAYQTAWWHRTILVHCSAHGKTW